MQFCCGKTWRVFACSRVVAAVVLYLHTPAVGWRASTEHNVGKWQGHTCVFFEQLVAARNRKRGGYVPPGIEPRRAPYPQRMIPLLERTERHIFGNKLLAGGNRKLKVSRLPSRLCCFSPLVYGKYPSRASPLLASLINLLLL